MEKISHCCKNMEYYSASQEESLLDYDSSVRTYNFILYKDNERLDLRQTLYFCPWCGTELPKELDEEWGNALEEEYGLTTDDFWNKEGYWDESKIPEEFRTDEWWKKRGL